MDKTFKEEYLDFSQIDPAKFIAATKETLYMTLVSMILVLIIGLLLGLALFFLRRSERKSGQILYTILSIFSNICRSIPFIILIILIVPFTRLLVGTMLGSKAAIPALVISASPFFGRLVDIALREVDGGVLEAAEAMGANRWQIIWKVLIPESLPALVSGLTVSTITMIGYTAMAGVISAGGLGQYAYQGGFVAHKQTVALFATIGILIIVFIIQGLGDFATKRVDKR